MQTTALITQAEAARRLGISRPRVHVLLSKGRLQCVNVNGRRMVDVASLATRHNPPKAPNRSNSPNRSNQPNAPEVLNVREVQFPKHCTQCKTILTTTNTFQHNGKMYSRCRACHTRSTMFDSYRNNAAKRGHEFALTRKHFSALTHEPCAYCGGMHHKGYNGIDRIDSSVGYVLGNVVAACKTCNLAKSNLPVAEWLAWLKRIKAAPTPQWLHKERCRPK